MKKQINIFFIILLNVFSITNVLAIDVSDPKKHAFHSFVDDGLYGTIDTTYNSYTNTTEYQPDITMPSGVLVDEVYMKIAFKIGVIPDIDRIKKIRCQTDYWLKIQETIQVFDHPKTQFHYKIVGNFLILVNNYVDGRYEAEALRESCGWEVILKGIAQKIPLYIPILWLTYYSTKRRSEYHRLQQEYAHKEALAKSYSSYKKQLEKLDSNDLSMQKEFIMKAIDAITYNASETLDGKHGDKMPVQELIDKLVVELAKTQGALK